MASAGKKRVLWLHTQPEHYHNCMMDDLARGTPYRVEGMGDEHSEEFEWTAAFSAHGPGWYKGRAQPEVARTVFLRAIAGKEGRPPTMGERYHVDWRADLGDLPFDAAIVSGYATRTSRQVVRACGRRGIPVALWSDSNLRGDRGHCWRSRLKRAVKRRVLRRLAGSVQELLTANGRGVAFWRYYGGPAARSNIDICPYYADYARIDAARGRSRAETLAPLGLKETDRYVISPARLIHAKGLDLMIRAFLAGRYPERGWKYVIAGTGSLEAELKALAGGEAGRSILFVGFQQPSENLALMAHAELMALPSRFEPHGIVIAESLAAGTPVLVSNMAGAAYGLVQEGRCGIYFRSGDEAELGRKLAIIDDAEKMRVLRAGARSAFEAWYRQTSPMLVVPRAVRRMLAGRVR